MTEMLITILILYVCLVIVLLIGWIRIRRFPIPPRTSTPPGVSVVVAFRHEAQNLENIGRNVNPRADPIKRAGLLEHADRESLPL